MRRASRCGGIRSCGSALGTVVAREGGPGSFAACRGPIRRGRQGWPRRARVHVQVTKEYVGGASTVVRTDGGLPGPRAAV
ncbi:unnamed protein product [Urochloa humidicola]